MQQRETFPKVFAIFRATACNFSVKFYTFIICLYSHNNAKVHIIRFNCDIVIIFSVSTLSFFCIHMLHVVCRTNVHDLVLLKNNCHLSNIINSLLMTENLNCMPQAVAHAFNLLVKFLTALLVANCPRSPAVPA